MSKKLSAISMLLTIMVVYVHSYDLPVLRAAGWGAGGFSWNAYLQFLVSQGLARVAVPLFFVMSGYLFFRDFMPSTTWFVRKAKRRVISLVIPYLSWSCLGVCFYSLMQSLPQARPFFTRRLIAEYTYSDLIYTVLLDPIPYQLWFLRDLILLVLFSPLVLVGVRRAGWVPPVLLIGLWLAGFQTPGLDLGSLAFFSLGCACSILPRKTALPGINALLLVAPWLLAEVTVTYFIVAHGVEWGPLTRVIWLLGVGSVWLGYDRTRDFWEKSGILRLAPYSFFIYAFHEPFLTIVKKLSFHIFGVNNTTSMMVFLVSPMVTIAVAIAVAAMLQEYAIRVYGFLVGYRLSAIRYLPSAV